MSRKFEILLFAVSIILARMFGAKTNGDTMILVSPLVPSVLGRALIFNSTLGGVKYLVLASDDAIMAHEMGHIALHREGVNQSARTLANEVFCDLHSVCRNGPTAVIHMLNVLSRELEIKAAKIRKWSTFFGKTEFGLRYQSIMESYASVVEAGVEEISQRRKFVIALTIKGDEYIASQFKACFPSSALRHLV